MKKGSPTVAVGVRELKSRLTTYLRLVKAEQTVVVTERGRAIARIEPIHGTEVVSLGAKLAALAARGLVRLPTAKPLRTIRAVKVTGPSMAATVTEGRR